MLTSHLARKPPAAAPPVTRILPEVVGLNPAQAVRLWTSSSAGLAKAPSSNVLYIPVGFNCHCVPNVLPCGASVLSLGARPSYDELVKP